MTKLFDLLLSTASSLNSVFPPCNVTYQSPFRIDITTDYYHEESSWYIEEILNDDNRAIVHSVDFENNGYSNMTFYSETYCLTSSSCFQFTMEDYYGDGMTEGGSYELFFDDVSIFESEGYFNKTERSPQFGYACPTPSPSVQYNPSSDPSEHPTWSPTLSQRPTVSPTQSLDLIRKDHDDPRYARRFFSHYHHHQSSSPSSPSETMPYYEWIGTSYTKPPVCQKRKKTCEPGFPQPRRVHSITEGLKPIKNPFDPSIAPIELPDKSLASSSVSVTVADVDNDGYLDLIFGNWDSNSTNSVQLLLNQGDESFSDPISITSNTVYVTSLFAADINNDGWVDIIVGSNGGSNQLLMNKQGINHRGGQFFEEPLDLPGGETLHTTSVFAADVNNDGMLDIIIGNIVGRNFLLLNDDGSFDDYLKLDFQEGTSTYTIFAADFDNDGFVDILVGNRGQSNELLLNNGEGRFDNVIALPDSNSYTTCLSAIDINNDGLLDIVVGNNGEQSNVSEQNYVLKNLGNGVFDNPYYFEDKDITEAMAIADVNNDGTVDIVFANRRQSNKILINTSNQSFEKAIDEDALDLPSSKYFDTSAIAIADLNNDGFVDFIFGNYRQPNQVLFTVTAQGYQYPVNIKGMKESRAITLVDVDNDGTLDVVSGNTGDFGAVNELNINDGFGGFSEPISLPSHLNKTKTLSMITVDINKDGFDDIICGNDQALNNIIFNYGNGTFIVEALPGEDRTETTSIAVADINGDGLIDIILGNYKSPNQILLQTNSSNSSSSFQSIINLPGGDTSTSSLSIADINNDGKVDIIIGNDSKVESNQLLINHNDIEGISTWMESMLPGSNQRTKTIALADMDNDGRIDIVVGNDGHHNQLLLNQNGNYTFALDLTDDLGPTNTIALADINDDGYIDIVVGNDRVESYILLNSQRLDFVRKPIARSDVSARVTGIAVGDVNGDGLLDLVLANDGEANKFIPYSLCPDGGARLHHHSWCFRCPSFMGRVVSPSGVEQSSICRECPPDYLQQPGVGEQCDMYRPCYPGERKLGEDLCSERCSNGTFYTSDIDRTENDPSRWGATPRCVECGVGEYAGADRPAINFCFRCTAGSYQNSTGSSSCRQCPAGQYQPENGQDRCIECKKGGYCNATESNDGGFQRCPPGTYNDETGKDSSSDCKKCPVGTYSLKDGAESQNDCMKCRPGTFCNETGATDFHFCDEGTYQTNSGSIKCELCPQSTYADSKGFRNCISCPFPLSSFEGSTKCTLCRGGYFLNDTSATGEEIFLDPFKYCHLCPKNGAKCYINTSISDLDIQEGYWRHSNHTSTVYKCESKKACIGSRSEQNRKTEYCAENHSGPLCESCIDNSFFFSKLEGKCQKCPQRGLLIVFLVGIVIACIIVVALVFHVFANFFYSYVSSLSLQAKFKLLISFYQIISSLEDVYGVKISTEVVSWAKTTFDVLSLDFMECAGLIPLRCLFESTRQFLLLNVTLPYILIMLASLLMVIYATYKLVCDNDEKSLQEDERMTLLQRRFIQFSVFVIYVSLPSACRSAFNAIKCSAFKVDDAENESRSYLIIDMNIECTLSNQSSGYQGIFTMFLVMLVIWAILTPTAFILILMKIRKSVTSNSITFLADACRFLWQDYKPTLLFWDVVDSMRKITLTGFIMFIDLQEGSTKFFRLIVGSIVSVTYFGILLVFRPYKRNDDYILAFISNLLLVGCFILGVILKLCDDSGNFESCSAYISTGLDPQSATIIVFLLALSMLFVTISFIIILAIQKVKAPVVRLVSNGRKPILELSEECKFHVFASHVWSTGQDRTHSIVRKLQLYMPGIKIWLDVDNLQDMSKLEESVAESTVFLLYYSKGYFLSKSCRREVYTAVNINKPIILVYEGDDTVIEQMKQECILGCADDNDDNLPDADTILEQILQTELSMSFLSIKNEPIQWLKDGVFSAAALNRLYFRILWNLPHYQMRRYELMKGIAVPGEMGPITLTSPVDILFLESNVGAEDVIIDLMDMEDLNTEMIQKYNALTYLEEWFDDTSSNDESGLGSQQGSVSDDGNQQYEAVVGSSERDKKPQGRHAYLLVYLNKHTFANCQPNNQGNELVSIIEKCAGKGIKMILVHEQSTAQGCCDFKTFFHHAPPKLYQPPLSIFNDIAIPLYSNNSYRRVSLKRIGLKVGATLISRRLFGGRDSTNLVSLPSSYVIDQRGRGSTLLRSTSTSRRSLTIFRRASSNVFSPRRQTSTELNSL